MSEPWEESFVAASAMLGEPGDATLAALDDAAIVRAAPIARALRATSRAARARAIAAGVAAILHDLEASRLAWR